jgi:protein TonB
MAVLFLIIVLNSSIVRFSKPVVIDFSIEDSAVKDNTKTAPAPKNREVKARGSEPLKPKQVVAKQEPVIPQKAAPQQVASTSETSAESQAPVATNPVVASAPQESNFASPAGNIAKAEGNASPAQGQGNSVEGMKQGYLKEHFVYIRDMIMKNISYPHMARKMGWEGRVVISFVVEESGRVEDIRVIESSGIGLLDKNAVQTIIKASPFPKPPIKAALIIPVVYKLN